MRSLTRSLVILLCVWASCFAQETRGTIVGRVLDASGAVIPSAKVEIVSQSQGTKFTATTNEDGLYQAPFLIPGQYSVSVEVQGFRKFRRENIELRINDRIEVEIKLEVGSPDQSVTVSSETPLLNTESASLGTVVDGKRVTELPIPHGNAYFLMGLAAGVSFNRDPRLDRPFEPTHIVGYSMDGTRANRSDITLDGASSTATANGGEVIASYVPPADMIAEFKVQTATFDASFGNTEGGVTNMSIKSGTNQLKGTLYYTSMSPETSANDFFANANRVARPDFFYHRFGGTVGGPIRIPKIYDGRNKTFFMYGYEGIKEGRPRNNGTPTVPTQEYKNGDFSRLLGVASTYQIYNPFTRRAIAGGRIQSDPFPNNIIPASLFNPISKRVLDNFYPAPRSAGNADGTNNYLRPELLEQADYGSHTIRLDHNFSEKHRMFGRTSWYDRDSNYNNYFDNSVTGEWFQFISRAAVLDDVYNLNATTVLNLRYGYNRFIRVTSGNPASQGFHLTSLGFPAAYNSAISPDIRRFPRFDIAGYQGTGVGGEYRPNDTHNFVATLNKASGAHFWKTGMEFRSYRENAIFSANNQTGQFNFDSTWTRGPLDNSPNSPNQLGQSVAAFLLGVPTGSSFVARAADYAEQSTAWGFFIHDDWKVNSRLTLNLGVRLEFETPLTERFNRSVSGFDFAATQPWQATAQQRYLNNPTPEVSRFSPLGGLLFAGNSSSRGLFNTPKANLLPRFGFAYKANQKTVIRGGFGQFMGFLGQRRGDVIQTGFSRNTTFVPSLDNVSFIANLSNPFPNGILEPLGNALGTQTFVGQSVTFYNQRPVPAKMNRWQLGFQRELRGGFVWEASYVGNKGTNIEIGQNLNVTPQRFLATSRERDNDRINYLSTNMPNPMSGLLPAGAIGALNGSVISRERLLRPFPQFDAVNTTRFDGYSWYHSLQTGIEKRFSKGYTLQMNYTFSKFMQATELLQADDLRPQEVISDFDRPHRIAVSGIWELPFGRNLRPLPRAILGGWQFTGVYTYQTGAPINWGNIIFRGDIKNINLPSDQRSPARWFNTDAGFEKSAALQLANNVRTFPLRFSGIRAMSINNYDLALFKNTRFRERYNAQFKAEFLNAFNTPLFPSPNTTPTVAAFGQAIAATQANYPRRIQLTVKFLF